MIDDDRSDPAYPSPLPRGGDMARNPLSTVRAWLLRRLDDGEACPCCGQYARVYRRRINSGMARALVLLYRAGGTDYVHKPTVLRGVGSAARDESLLRYWNLLEERPEPRREDGGRAGWWRVTHEGFEWIHGYRTVPSHALIYDGRPLALVGEPVTIQACLGERFDLAELLEGR